MYRLAIEPSERRQGVATALVAVAERRLFDKGARRVTALVAHDDHVANHFWEAAGYQKDDDIGRRVRSILRPDSLRTRMAQDIAKTTSTTA